MEEDKDRSLEIKWETTVELCTFLEESLELRDPGQKRGTLRISSESRANGIYGLMGCWVSEKGRR